MMLDTAGPEPREDAAVHVLADMLTRAGFRVETHAFAPGRLSLIARHGYSTPSHSARHLAHWPPKLCAPTRREPGGYGNPRTLKGSSALFIVKLRSQPARALERPSR